MDDPHVRLLVDISMFMPAVPESYLERLAGRRCAGGIHRHAAAPVARPSDRGPIVDLLRSGGVPASVHTLYMDMLVRFGRSEASAIADVLPWIGAFHLKFWDLDDSDDRVSGPIRDLGALLRGSGFSGTLCSEWGGHEWLDDDPTQMTRDHLALARRALNGENDDPSERADPVRTYDDRARQRTPQLPAAQPVADDPVEDTGRFKVRVVEDPRGLGAEIIDKYDVVIVVFEGRDGYFEKAVGFGRNGCGAPALRARRRQGHRVVPRLGGAGGLLGVPGGVQRHARREAQRVRDGARPRPWGEALLQTAEPRHPITEGINATWTVTGDDILTGVQLYEGAQVLLTTFDDLEAYEKAPVWPMSHYPVVIPEGGIAELPGMNTDQPIAWINEYGAGRSFTITIGHDIDTFRRIEFIRMFPRGVEWAATGEVALEGPDRRGERRFLPWPYYNHEG